MFRSKPRLFNFFSMTMLVVGAAAGAAVALLFAPMTGRKLQKQLKGVIEDQVETMQSVVKRVVA